MLEAFETHPSASIRSDASRRAWNLLGDELSEPGAPKQSLLELLPRLAPNDKLLRRDAHFFPKAKAAMPRRKTGQTRPRMEVHFYSCRPRGRVVRDDEQTDTSPSVRGEVGNAVFIRRSGWDGATEMDLGFPNRVELKSGLAV